MMRPNAVLRAIGQYLTTTTLHGFKYLYTPYGADRVVWLLSCLASASCAGVLCGVLWSRFTQVPNVLALRALDLAGAMPLSAICVPTEVLAENIIRDLSGANRSDVLPKALSRGLLGKPTEEYKLAYVEFMLKNKTMSLHEALLRNSPTCSEIATRFRFQREKRDVSVSDWQQDLQQTRCRVNRELVDCNVFISRDLTPYGVCCVSKPLHVKSYRKDLFEQMKLLDIVINSTTSTGFSGYNLITQFDGKGWVKTSTLVPGYMYIIPLSYQSIVGGDNERIVDNCVIDEDYSRIECFESCVEKSCGCSDPLRSMKHKLDHHMPPCSLARIMCLRRYDDCECPPSCRKITTYMSLEFSPMNALKYSIDPLYVGLNWSETIVLQIAIKLTGSHVFTRMPTETWFTLLSSLGGVFNMFLGVGLFSALELFYFVFVKIPMAVRAETS